MSGLISTAELLDRLESLKKNLHAELDVLMIDHNRGEDLKKDSIYLLAIERKTIERVITVIKLLEEDANQNGNK